MNKSAIKKFAIEARRKLIDSVTDKAGMLGITPEKCSDPITKGTDFEVYQTAAGTEVTLNKRQCEQRKKLEVQINVRGFEAVVEEVAYTWFNRICAIRFMEVNDYLPNRVRVLSSEVQGKTDPDIVTKAPDVELNFTEQEKEEIIDLKQSGRVEDTDILYRKLFLKQCHQLHEVLPGLFEEDSDYMELLFGISYANKDDVIYKLVNPDTGIPEEDFYVGKSDGEEMPTGQVEIIGWLYQYYNTELKDDTFAKLKKNVKITKERIPAATQLFTPDWIVRYMVENSVGRLWIEHLRAIDPATDEKATAEQFGWKYYLPEAEQEEAVNVKLAEIRTTYKDLKPTDITCIDPCMGSGHILIAMFDVLMDIYIGAGYDKREAAFEIVENNIHGLDIDKRAYQLAYFSVMMKGRGYNRRFLRGRDGKRIIPKVFQILESGYTDQEEKRQYEFDKETLNYFVHNDDVLRENMNIVIDAMFDAREYGSIIKCENVRFDLIFNRFEEIKEEISLYKNSVLAGLNPFVYIAYMLNKKYHAVVTNPPYMLMNNADEKLYSYVQNAYPVSKADLCSVFIERCRQLTKNNMFFGMITMHSWMFTTSFEELRKELCNCMIVNMAHLGARAFEEIGGEVVQTTSFVMKNTLEIDYSGTYVRLLESNSQDGKELLFLRQKNKYISSYSNYTKIIGSPIAYWVSTRMCNAFSQRHLADYAQCCTGMQTGNNDKYVRNWFEVNLLETTIKKSNGKYKKYNCGGENRKWYGNHKNVVLWGENGESIRREKSSVIRNEPYYYKEGISWKRIGTSTFNLRYLPEGFIFDQAGDSMFLKNKNDIYYILAFVNSKVAVAAFEFIAPTMNLTAGNMNKLPIIYAPDQHIDDLVKQNIEISKDDWDAFETSWEFKSHPLMRNNGSKVYRSWNHDDIVYVDEKTENIPWSHLLELAYQTWKSQCEIRFNQLKTNEEELNRIFIDIYGLQDELSPEVEDKDVTVRKADLQRDIKSFLSYAVGCMFGRYSLDREGLVFAGGDFEDVFHKKDVLLADGDGSVLIDSNGAALATGEEYYGSIKQKDGSWAETTFYPDMDNCIPITDEEYFTDDIVGRFVEFVKTVYGADTLEENLDFIAKALGNKGNTSREVIRNYFLKDFYADHLKVYQKRPIYWLFDSGKENGFKALIYMHRYNADTVGRVRTDYLHRAQKYVETAMQSAQYTIDNATSASEKSKATKAVTKYTKQLAEMKIYDEAIAHIANKRIEIDLDDGVKVNYSKFQGVEIAQEGKKALKVDLLAKLK